MRFFPTTWTWQTPTLYRPHATSVTHTPFPPPRHPSALHPSCSTICTIHQPSRRLFFAFDWLYLMKRGGEVVYFGPIGHNGCDLLVGSMEC
ncbi:unnamed protein product [Closterium sp. NIES-54]